MVEIGWGSVISGAIGAGAAILVMLGRHELDKRRRRKKLRRALYAELNSINRLNVAHDMLGSQSGIFFYTHHDFIPTSVYESHLSDLGLLSEEEIEKVVRFYNNALVAKEEINASGKVLDDNDRDHAEVASAVGSTRASLEILTDLQADAIEAIGQHVGEAFSQRVRLTQDESEEEDEEVKVNIKSENDSNRLVERETAIIEFDASPEQLQDIEVQFNDEVYRPDDSGEIEIELPEAGTYMITFLSEDSKDSTSIDVQPRSDEAE